MPRFSSRLTRSATTAWFATPLLAAALFVAPSLTAATETLIERPRPLSAAEEVAIRLALDYLDRGPDAWLEALHPNSTLAALPASEAGDEIGVRAGPRRGAAWRLQTAGPGQPQGRAIFNVDFPSGVSDTLVVDLERTADGDWAIHRLRTMVDTWDELAYALPDDDEAATAPTLPLATPTPPPAAALALLLATLLIAALVAAAAFATRRPRPALAPLAATLALLLAAGLLHACGFGGAGEAASKATATTSDDGQAAPADASADLALGALRPLREAIALGRERARIEELLTRVPADGPLRRTADLWLAELAFNQTDLSEIERVLDTLPEPAPVPLGDLLRARLAFLRKEPGEAAAAYERAISAGPNHDGIRLEAATALDVLGLSIEAELEYDLLAEMGSRLAEVYYGKAMYAVLLDKPARGEDYLRLAWKLQPLERDDLLANPLLGRLVTRPELFPTFEFSEADEPVVEPPSDERRPLRPPSGTAARLTGGLLHMAIGDGTLVVPGGWVVAPALTVRLTADALRREEEETLLARLPELTTEVEELGALAHPRRRVEVVKTGIALGRYRRWQDLVDLTAALDVESLDRVPGLLVQLRAAALSHVDRDAEARDLLIRLATSDLANRRRDPGSLYQLADLMATEGEFDVAKQLIRKAANLSPLAANDARLRQIELQRELAASNGYWDTDHFRIVYPRITGEKYARQLGMVLEEEHERLRRWIPLHRLPADPGAGPIEVHLHPLREFLQAYSGGSLVLGVYDGVVRVPLADLRSLHPELVSILSHELAHAMIARYTDDQAPKWLHEGLAEHVQMKQDWINPYPDLAASDRLIAFPVIEPILNGFAEPQLVELAYGQAAWVVHYVEAEHGVPALHRLLDAFRQGATTEAALTHALEMDAPGFDLAVRRWGTGEAPGAWPTEVRRYDHEFDLPWERSRPQEQRPARRAAAPAPPPADLTSEMMRWHRSYRRRVAGFKLTLSVVMGEVSAGDVDGRRTACGSVTEEASRLLGDNSLFATPDPSVGPYLKQAFESFEEMGRQCSRGDGQRAKNALAQAERQLADAARRMQTYSLRP